LWRVITDNAQRLTREKEESKPKRKKRKKTVKNPDKAPAAKAFKTRVYPTNEQKQILKKWMEAANWTYNNCVEAINKKTVKANAADLRAAFLNEEGLKEEFAWALETPYDIRDEAMRDVLKAVASNEALERPHFELKFRSKKDASQSIVFLAKHWSHKRGAFANVAGATFRSHEKLPETLEYDSRMITNQLGQFHLCVPRPLSVRSEVEAPTVKDDRGGVISLDPGVRTFMTGYDPSGKFAEWGAKDIGRIYRLSRVVDKLKRKWSDKAVKHKQRRAFQKAARRIRLKVTNLVDELHKKLAKWLCENYRVILLPKFETQKMSSKAFRKISSVTVRKMITWSHYRFQQRLINKAREYPWCCVEICDEAYTSKTCTKCGHINKKLGGNKTFKCSLRSCGFQIDRDFGGARNILLRYLTLNHLMV
jgi:putative transposase